MPTKKLVPRATTEGGLGTAAKVWGASWLSTLSLVATANTTVDALNINCDSLTSGSAIDIDVDDALTANSEKSLLYIDYDKSGITPGSPTTWSTTYGLDINMYDAATNEVGSYVNLIGATIRTNIANAQGSIQQKGLELWVGHNGIGDAAVTTGIQMVVMDGGTDIICHSSTDSQDYFSISTTTNGATTLKTNSILSGVLQNLAHLTVAVDGDILLKSDAAGDISFYKTTTLQASVETLRTESFLIALSDETSFLTTGTNKAKMRMPYAFTVTEVRASLSTTATGSDLVTVDINEGGATILTTKLTIDASETTSTTAAIEAVIGGAGPAIADDAEITFDIDLIGNTTAGKGLKVTIIGYKTV